MSNKTSTATEPNKPGLPDSPERGTGDASGQPAKAGVGVQGVIPEDVVENEQAPAPAAAKPAKGKAAAKPDVAWFRVKGPGSVKIDSVWHAPGAELKLARTEALSVNDYLEEIDEPS